MEQLSHVPQLLSQCFRTCQPQLLKPAGLQPRLCDKGSHRNEAPLHSALQQRVLSHTHLTQLEKAHAQQGRASIAQINKSYLKKKKEERKKCRTSLVVQCRKVHASNSGDMRLVPGQETKILHVTQHSNLVNKKKRNKCKAKQCP